MKLKIISAQKVVFEADGASYVSVPGGEGQMQILPEHENLVSTLDVGSVQVGHGNEEKEYFVNGGFVVVREDEVLVLVDDAAVPEEIAKEEIEKAIQNAQDKLSTITDPAELIQLEKQLRYEKFKRDRVS